MDRVAIDTNVLSDLIKGIDATIQIVNKYQVIFLPSIVLGETYYGINNSRNGATIEANLAELKQRISVLEIDELVAFQYGQIRLRLRNDGKPIPENDIWIAATCLANNLPLLTHDQHFDHVAGLEVIHP